MKPFTLDQYRVIVASLSTPTAAQMQDFANFVSKAHSWYKRLPLLLPRGVIHFFLNPAAGMQIVSIPEWKLAAEPRTEPGHHYSMLRTDECRSSRSAPAVIDPSVAMRRELPPEVVEAGRALVSGLVHPAGSDCLVHLDQEHLAACNWPEDSGGRQQFETILDRIAVLKNDPSQRDSAELSARVNADMDDPVDFTMDSSLHRLVEPERRRQRAGMVEAMERACDLISARGS